MCARTDGANDVASVELADGEKIERCGEEADPRGATHGIEEQVANIRVGVHDGGDKMQDQWSSEDYVRGCIGGEGRNYFCVEDAINQCWQRYRKSDERAGSADIEESARGADG